jgi:hypothetical protein
MEMVIAGKEHVVLNGILSRNMLLGNDSGWEGICEVKES